MSAAAPARPGSAASWLLAARPRTLPAAIVPVAVGSALAASEGALRTALAALALVTALLLQVAANFANDVFDHERGADTEERLGPRRAVQSGLLSSEQMRSGLLVVLGLAALCGLGLVWAGGWPILMLGVLSLAAAVAYTGGPWPLGYHGLGDACVFLFFGLVGVGGTYFLHTGALSARALAAAVPVGCFATAMLAVNNLRDLDTDRKAGKRTLAVRTGRLATQRYYCALLVAALAAPPALALAGWAPPAVLATLVAAPFACKLAAQVRGSATGRALNETLARTARLGLLHGLLLAAGFLA